MPTWVHAYRISFALLALATIAYQPSSGVARGSFDVGNFFSLVTVQSTFFAALVLLSTASGGTPSHRRDLICGAALAYMATTGVAYGLLRGDPTATPQTPAPWDNTVLHRPIPVVLVADWLLVPLAFFIYSLARGPLIGWDPYYFLDPGKVGGCPGVARYALGFFLFVWLIVVLGQRVRLRVKAAQA